MAAAQRSAGVALTVAGAAAGIAGAYLLYRAYAQVDPEGWGGPNVLPSVLAIGVGLLAMAAGALLYTRAHAQDRDLPGMFLTPEEEEKVEAAIEGFEKRTSGELRVHLGSDSHGAILEEAKRVFEELGLTATRERNAVLFYVCVREHRFAVLGDEGIDRKVPPGFWDEVVKRVSARFAERRFADGLTEGITMAGEALAAHFPPRADDVNELPNQISRT